MTDDGTGEYQGQLKPTVAFPPGTFQPTAPKIPQIPSRGLPLLWCDRAEISKPRDDEPHMRMLRLFSGESEVARVLVSTRLAKELSGLLAKEAGE